MAQNEVDLIDVGALVLLPVAAGMVLGVWEFSIQVFGGFDFSQPIWSSGQSSVSIALLLTVGSIAWIVTTNEIDGSDYEDYEFGMIVGGFALTPMYSLIPLIKDLVDSSDLFALVAWLAVAIVSVYISYVE